MNDTTTVTTTVTVSHERTAILEASLRAAYLRIDALTQTAENCLKFIADLKSPPVLAECLKTVHYHDDFEGAVVCHWYYLGSKTDPIDVELVGCYINNNNAVTIIKNKFKKDLKKWFWQKFEDGDYE